MSNRKRVESEHVIGAISLDRATVRNSLTARYSELSKPGYSLPMAWSCAVKMSNMLVDAVPRYSSADHGSIFKSLISVTNNILMIPGYEFKGPHFDRAYEYDEAIQSCLQGEYHLLEKLNLEVSLSEDYWRLWYIADSDVFRLSLAPMQRRSALMLLDHKVEHLSLSPDEHTMLSGEPSSDKMISFILANGMREVEFLSKAVPEAWSRFIGRVGFTTEDIVRFHAFVQWLMTSGQLWFQPDNLKELYSHFTDERSLPPIPDDHFQRLVEFFSAPSDILASWGIVVPLVRFGEWLALWPFIHHVLPPSLTSLSLLMRKYPDDWNNSVGSELAKVADAIRTQLPSRPGLLYAVTKSKTGVGDIDLGIYDLSSRVLLLCEIKTVFDRFRTNYQQSNFTKQRTNYVKASAQLASSSQAIASGAWRLSEIFERKIDGPPVKILSLVLTWYDQHNPWLGIEGENPACCNFRVFQYLFTQAGGDITMAYTAIDQLSRIYCVAALPAYPLNTAGKRMKIEREVQTDLLPPKESLDEMLAYPRFMYQPE